MLENISNLLFQTGYVILDTTDEELNSSINLQKVIKAGFGV
jgi:hypothetical protein